MSSSDHEPTWRDIEIGSIFVEPGSTAVQDVDRFGVALLHQERGDDTASYDPEAAAEVPQGHERESR